MESPESLAEDAAHRLLARAVELDMQRSGSLSIDQLREIARDAGIAPRALEDALAEARAATPKRSWSSWIRYGIANAVGVGAFWYSFRAATSLLLPMNSTLGIMLIDIVATFLGMAAALRMRGRLAAAVIGVFAAAQIGALLGLYSIHVHQGAQLFASWGWAALGLAATCGVGLGAVLTRNRHDHTPPLAPLQSAVHSPIAEPGRDSQRPGTSRDLQLALSLAARAVRPDRAAAV